MKIRDAITLLAGGPGSGRHKESEPLVKIPSNLYSQYKGIYNPKKFTPYKGGQIQDYDKAKELFAVKVKDVDISNEHNVKTWSPEDKKGVEQYQASIKNGDTIEPLELYHDASGKLLIEDGDHRAVAYRREGKSHMLAWVAHGGKNIHAGGPGSGCRGDNCGRPHSAEQGKASAKSIINALTSISKTKDVPQAVVKGAEQLSAMGMDRRYLQKIPLTKFEVKDLSSISPLAVGYYNESKRQLSLAPNVDTGTFVHELTHHLDIAYLRKGGDAVNQDVANKVREMFTKEYKAARNEVTARLGHRFNFDKDYEKMATMHFPNVVTHYAVSSSKEWFAEAAYLYARGGASRARIERIAPETTKAIKMVFSGKILK